MESSVEGVSYLVVTGCCRVNSVCADDFFVCVVSVIDTDLCLVSVVLCVELALCVDIETVLSELLIGDHLLEGLAVVKCIECSSVHI